VYTRLGALHGQSVSVKGTKTRVHNYLGVPFARPPVGPLRLAWPQPTDGWEGLRDATKQPFMCGIRFYHGTLTLKTFKVFATLGPVRTFEAITVKYNSPCFFPQVCPKQEDAG